MDLKYDTLPENAIFLVVRVGDEVRPVSLSECQKLLVSNVLSVLAENEPIRVANKGFKLKKDEKKR